MAPSDIAAVPLGWPRPGHSPAGWLVGEYRVSSKPGGPKHLHVTVRETRGGGWRLTVWNNGVLIKSTGGGNAGPIGPKAIIRHGRALYTRKPA